MPVYSRSPNPNCHYDESYDNTNILAAPVSLSAVKHNDDSHEPTLTVIEEHACAVAAVAAVCGACRPTTAHQMILSRLEYRVQGFTLGINLPFISKLYEDMKGLKSYKEYEHREIMLAILQGLF